MLFEVFNKLPPAEAGGNLHSILCVRNPEFYYRKMKRVFFLALILVFAVGASLAQNTSQAFDLSQYGVKIEPDRRLIVVLASLEAAGLDTPLTEKGRDFRQKLRADLATLNPDLQQKMAF